MTDHAEQERRTETGRRTEDRLWAYSDAVFAVIVTIMVLQLRPPRSHDLSALWGLWPTFISYVVSYVFIAIVWINYHHLTRFVPTPPLGLMWLNFLHLFLVSLVPFTTAWAAQTRLASAPVLVYTGLFVCAAGVFNMLEYRILHQSRLISESARQTARQRSLVALTLFAVAALAAALEPWLGFGLVCLALGLHIKPDVGSGRPPSRA